MIKFEFDSDHFHTDGWCEVFVVQFEYTRSDKPVLYIDHKESGKPTTLNVFPPSEQAKILERAYEKNMQHKIERINTASEDAAQVRADRNNDDPDNRRF